MGMMGGPGFSEHMLDLVNATEAQRTQIDAILKAARTDLKAQHEANAALHTQMRDLFTATVVDAAAIEAVRAKLSVAHDAVSKRMTHAAVDAARVLTPEQRAKLADLAKKRAARVAKRHAG
jgi:Spy/CpxP family protein refolding chaperone